MEDELAAFSTVGYMGESSPNRADALIWALAALFPAMIHKKEPVIVQPIGQSMKWITAMATNQTMTFQIWSGATDLRI
jgi:hypothetical protein